MSAQVRERGKRIELRLPLEVEGQDESGGTFAESTQTRNLSGGGLCFETNRPLAVGQRVTLRVQLPESLRRHFGGRAVYHVRAILCRVERPPGEAVTLAGARFRERVEPEGEES